METLFFSIIVPIYNVERYLDKCIRSILCQNFEDYELILVDDGSQDRCPQKCDSWRQKAKRIKVIHKENGGLSDARNAGLNIARGKYIIFIDSDDYWCDNTLLEKLKNRVCAFDEEIVLFGCKIVKEDSSEEVSRNDYNLDILNKHNKAESLRYLFNSGKMPGAAWILTVKKSLVDKLNLSFRHGVTAEDYEWIISLLSECNAIGAIEGVHYAYIRRDGSITTSANISGIKGIMHAIDKYKSLDNPDLKSLADYMCRIYLIALMSYSCLPYSESQEGKKQLRQYKNILKEGTNKMYYWVISILGYYLSSKLVRRVYSSIR